MAAATDGFAHLAPASDGVRTDYATFLPGAGVMAQVTEPGLSVPCPLRCRFHSGLTVRLTAWASCLLSRRSSVHRLATVQSQAALCARRPCFALAASFIRIPP